MSGERSARINRAGDDVLGATIFLSDDELRELGVEADTASSVQYRVSDGELRIEDGGADE